MKRIIAMIVCCVLILGCVFQLAGCEKKASSAEEALKMSVEFLMAEDVSDGAKLIPPDVYDYFRDFLERKEYEYTEKEMNQILFQSVYSYFGSEYKLDYEIISKYSATDEEIAEYSTFNGEKFGFDDKIEEMTVIKFKLNYQYGSGASGNLTHNALCMKIGGKWYLLTDRSGQTDIFWKTDDGDCVEWINEKFEN